MVSSSRRAVVVAISTIFLSTAAILLLLLVPNAQAEQPQPLAFDCDDDADTYTKNDTFSSNLDMLLKTLSSEATATGYADGKSSNIRDVVYGLVLCRGDVLSLSCLSCLRNASRDVLKWCPLKKAATIWYDQCLLRYSSSRLASDLETDVKCPGNADVVTSEWPRFNRSLVTLLGQLRRYAAYNTSAPPPQMFATGLIEFSGQYRNAYALVQCTRDLSNDGCNRCLNNIIGYLPKCCDQKIGGRVLTPSCNFRYETHRFYDSTPMITLPAISDLSSDLVPAPTTPTTPSANSNNNSDKENNKIGPGAIAAVVIAVVAVLFLLVCWMCCRRRQQGILSYQRGTGQAIAAGEQPGQLLYDLRTIRRATNNFSDKLGEGGFGVVYKGKLADGLDIAVKTLSKGSVQEREQLRNEVELLAKLRHRNLVKLLGFCMKGKERMLIYEYVENKSLDGFLFDDEKRVHLRWKQRYDIIRGIARGLHYLHEESPVKIIHRDLKAGNVLLDSRMSPKISDFGLARLFGDDQTKAITANFAGTIGYMSPEYALRGKISSKLDVFSFGVLVLEIVTGRRNNESFTAESSTVFLTGRRNNGSFTCENSTDILTGRRNNGSFTAENSTDLLAYTWDHWSGGRASDIVDPRFTGGYSQAEASRCIEIALLCVQVERSKRPSMWEVCAMLDGRPVPTHVLRPPALICRSVRVQNTATSYLSALSGGEEESG